MGNSAKKLVLFTSLPKVGGHSTLTLGLCRMLSPYFSEIEVWCKVMPEHGHSETLVEKLEEMGCRVKMLSDPSGRLLKKEFLRFAWSSLVRPPDVFFTLAMRHLSPLMAFFSQAGVRVYCQITHDLNPATIGMLRTYARFFTRIIFLCPATFEDFPGASGHPGKFAWVPQSSEIPVSGTRSLESERETACSAGRPIRFALIGRLTKEKGAAALLEFADRGSVPCEIHVAGSGPLAEEFQKRAEHPGGGAIVHFYGTYDPANREAFLRQFFNDVDYLVVPSQDEWETLSMAALEAMQFGVPSVVCRTGGLKSFAHPELGPAPDAVVHLVDPEQLSATLEDLARQPRPAWKSSGRLCLEHYDRYFSDPAVLKRWVDLLFPKNA